ncbi:hypothetical protein COT49_02375 [candidate division WWE3 bacterium CG08_land_8_20_14_0_20_40_13]|uniref:DNA replication and repair protein RecF n=1 Tax=candidate division WWE3 bacterium CG08_land_8_20_14_0_20_40_13 TaxID=1975084 RepID=A0A2H0XDL7_UNCKA|nr:MAG: hypothetical protein COT49_02375 [candidate division WWE3 bacterium CG08_land_8_20_14_0_20_40_13]
MAIKTLSLTNFRSWEETAFEFDPKINLMVGPNTSGKSNILEAVYFLAIGKSLQAQSQKEVIKWGKDHAKIIAQTDPKGKLMIVISENPEGSMQTKKTFKVNEVPKTRFGFLGNFSAVHFSPADIRLVIGSPTRRRDVLDQILSQADHNYLRALLSYQKIIKQKNKLLEVLKGKTGDIPELDFWNGSAEKNGKYIQESRRNFIKYCNTLLLEVAPRLNSPKESLVINYKPNIISKERLEIVKRDEIAKGVSLVGPHRDDYNFIKNSTKDLELYGSRGEQRTAVFALKLCEIAFLEESLKQTPVLLLDDIFSELDKIHRRNILTVLDKYQSIITTVEMSLVPKGILNKAKVFEI